MLLLIPKSLWPETLAEKSELFPIEVVVEAARRVRDKVAIPLGPKKKLFELPHAQYFKNDTTSSGGAGRIAWFVDRRNNTITPIVMVAKKDKRIGKNLAVSNPEFIKKFKANFALALEDLGNKNVEIVKL